MIESTHEREKGRMGKNWELHHLGLIVRDLDKAMEHYQSLGIAEIEPEFLFDSNTIPDYKVLGEPAHNKCRASMARIGQMPLEFLQQIEGTYPHKAFLNRYGEGIEHIAFLVDDVEKEVAELVEKGAEVILRGKDSDGNLLYAYVDTRKVGNIILELIQRPKD